MDRKCRRRWAVRTGGAPKSLPSPEALWMGPCCAGRPFSALPRTDVWPFRFAADFLREGGLRGGVSRCESDAETGGGKLRCGPDRWTGMELSKRAGHQGTGPGVITPDGCAVEPYSRLPVGIEPDVVAGAVSPGPHILELGCGVGRVTHPLLERGFVVTAVDEYQEMLDRIRGARAMRSAIEDLDLGETFDVVMLASFLEVGLKVDAYLTEDGTWARTSLAASSSSCGPRRPRPGRSAGSRGTAAGCVRRDRPASGPRRCHRTECPGRCCIR